MDSGPRPTHQPQSKGMPPITERGRESRRHVIPFAKLVARTRALDLADGQRCIESTDGDREETPWEGATSGAKYGNR